MDVTRVATDFELLDISVIPEGLDRIRIPLGPGPVRRPVELPEGAVVTVALTFRLGTDVDGLTFTDTRSSEGRVTASTQTPLGGFRAGGPYEIHLRPERLPKSRTGGDVTYDVTGVFTDGSGRVLASEYHGFRIVRQPRPVRGR
ncbi:hypothetical protein [Streptomyces sp. NRRL S-87]|uniref:hypothetical protein n=1 Tax=Streptomyces sp. NRRL S-87 TaxID=1463920 RepID=UPI0004BF92FB|nr:hypothetical protein [Streptomyces sp. NRRL S-87]